MNNFDNFCSLLRQRANAVAFINGSEKYPHIHGKVFFYTTNGGVLVRAEIKGLPKEENQCKNPIFAFHIHSGEECTGNETDPFANAKVHFNPKDCPHPYHAGDLPPLFSVNGNALSAFLTDRFTVSQILGKTVIIHGSVDDFTTQPSGNAGEKIACGIITKTARST